MAGPRATHDPACMEPVRTCDFEVIVGAERAKLGLDPDPRKADGVGLALSGGGIRSACFALGVVQALIRRGALEKMHYLSTVSGGGYLGAAITWFRRLSRGRDEFEAQFDRRVTRNGGWPAANQWLDFITHHSGYLMPRGIGVLGLASVVLRNALLGMGVYLGTAVLLLAVGLRMQVLVPPCREVGTHHLSWWSVLALPVRADAIDVSVNSFPTCPSDDAQRPANAAARVSSTASAMGTTTANGTWPVYPDVVTLLVAALMVLGVGCGTMSVSTFVASMPRRWQVVLTGAAFTTVFALFALGSAKASLAWFAPELIERVRWGLVIAFGTAVAFSAYYLAKELLPAFRTPPPEEEDGPPMEHGTKWYYGARIHQQKLFGALIAGIGLLLLFVGLGPLAILADETVGQLRAGAVATVLGALGATYQFLSRPRRTEMTSLFSHARVIATALLLNYGLLFLGYVLALRYAARFDLVVLLIAGFLPFALGRFTNLNLFGIGRMYRDRLMEAFMPDPSAVARNEWAPAGEADSMAVADIWPPRWCTDRLYPLVNTTAVLVDSANDTYRARGGDSFTLAPLYTGSKATGWIATRGFADRDVKYATAVAISGAAVNPRAASGGRGVTRNRFVSSLMFLMQLRLGAWVENPRPVRSRAWNAFRWLFGRPPNLWHPGVLGGLLGSRMHEQAGYVELTDGGHFDNTGLFELFRRRTRLIVLAQASADPKFQMADLANAMQRARVDFDLRFDEQGEYPLAQILPRPDEGGTASRGFAIIRIQYRTGPARVDVQDGWILYLQATPIERMTPDVASYFRRHPGTFPNETTANQFFSEEELECYRELGYQVAQRAFDEIARFRSEEAPPDYRGAQEFARALL